MFGGRRDLAGRWAAVMQHRRNDRGLVPAAWSTRCIRAGEIHEFILCSPVTGSTEPIDDVSYLGFAEIVDGGVLVVGDGLWSGDALVGTVHGFDEKHWPNHYNILIAAPRLDTGAELGLQVGATLSLKAG